MYNSREEEMVAAPIIKDTVYYVLKSNPNNPIPLKVLKEYVKESSGEEFSNGSFSGAMRDLIEETNGRILNISRGVYVYVEDLKKYQINYAIEKLIEDLDNIATDNILELTERDIASIREIPSLKQQLSQLFLT